MSTQYRVPTSGLLTFAAVLSLSSATVQAMPTVDGDTISWPDDGWYQVQEATNYQQICGGGLSCIVPPGRYIVINHTTGELFDNVTVGSTDSPIVVSGDTISWPDDGWYQVQQSDTYESVCNGGRSCTVSDGTYVVINHTNGSRFPNVVVGSAESPAISAVTVSGNTLSWPDDGWYQVQQAETYENICSGTRSCMVADGEYIVINHTTGTRNEGIVVPSTTDTPIPPVTEPGGPQPPTEYQLIIYSATAAELSWQPPVSGSPIIATEVYRDGVLLGQTSGNSWYDDQRRDGGNHLYELRSIDSVGIQSDVLGEGRFETAQLETGNGNNAFNNYGQVATNGNYAFVPADREIIGVSSDGVENSGAVYVYSINSSSGDWSLTQKLTGTDAGSYGLYVAIDSETLAISQRFDYSDDRASPSTNRSYLTVYSLSEDGGGGAQWEINQTVQLDEPDRGVYRFGDTISIDGDTMFVGASNDLVADPVYVFTRDAEGIWQQTQKINPTANENFRADSIAVEGNVAILGDPAIDDNGFLSGGAHVYERGDDGLWAATARLVPSVGSNSDFTGQYVAIDGEQLIVGQRFGERVFVYERNADGIWSEKQIIQATPSTESTLPAFARSSGTPVSADNGRLIVGAAQSSRYGLQTGVVTLYERDSAGLWAPVEYFAGSNVTSNQYFGDSVAIEGNTIVAGAQTPAAAGRVAGRRAYVFELPTSDTL